jgi:hypothetical protein
VLELMEPFQVYVGLEDVRLVSSGSTRLGRGRWESSRAGSVYYLGLSRSFELDFLR